MKPIYYGIDSYKYIKLISKNEPIRNVRILYIKKMNHSFFFLILKINTEYIGTIKMWLNSTY